MISFNSPVTAVPNYGLVHLEGQDSVMHSPSFHHHYSKCVEQNVVAGKENGILEGGFNNG